MPPPSLHSRRRSALRATRLTYAILAGRATTAAHIEHIRSLAQHAHVNWLPETPTPATARLAAATIALLECEGRVKAWEEEHRV